MNDSNPIIGAATRFECSISNQQNSVTSYWIFKQNSITIQNSTSPIFLLERVQHFSDGVNYSCIAVNNWNDQVTSSVININPRGIIKYFMDFFVWQSITENIYILKALILAFSYTLHYVDKKQILYLISVEVNITATSILDGTVLMSFHITHNKTKHIYTLTLTQKEANTILLNFCNHYCRTSRSQYHYSNSYCR